MTQRALKETGGNEKIEQTKTRTESELLSDVRFLCSECSDT